MFQRQKGGWVSPYIVYQNPNRRGERWQYGREKESEKDLFLAWLLEILFDGVRSLRKTQVIKSGPRYNTQKYYTVSANTYIKEVTSELAEP